MEREREEQELQQALAQSLQEQVRNKVCFPELSSPITGNPMAEGKAGIRAVTAEAFGYFI